MRGDLLRTAYIANVGTRDINVGGKTLADIVQPDKTKPPEKSIRDYSAEILDEYGTYRGRITAPILEPGLRQVLDSLGPDGQIDTLLMFVTDQTDPNHRKNDTLFIGAILERRLPEIFGGRIGNVECCSIPHNPSGYDEMHAFFARELRNRIKSHEHARVWAAPVGGPPACTNGLILNVVGLYGDASRLIFVYENGTSRTLDLHRTILQKYATEQAKAHLDRRDFGALGATMKSAGLGHRWHWEVCTYAERRLHFDFRGAHEALLAAEKQATDESARNTIARYRQSLQPMMQNVPRPSSLSTSKQTEDWFAWQSRQIAELYFNLRHKAAREEWVDFLGRVYRLHEAGLRLMFERKENRSTDKDTKELRTWLEQQAKKEPSVYGSQVPRCLKLENLKKIRNQTIMAHDFQGVSFGRIEAALAGQDIHTFVAGDMCDYLAHPQIGAKVDAKNDPLTDVILLLEKALES